MTTERTTQDQLSMSDHPDLGEMRDRFDRIADSRAVQTVEGLTVLAGLYAAISPWIIDFHGSNPSLTLSNLIVGLTVAIVALGMSGDYARMHGISWVLPVLGAWLIVSMWAIAGTSLDAGIIVSGAIVGGLVVVFGAAAMATQRMRRGQHR